MPNDIIKDMEQFWSPTDPITLTIIPYNDSTILRARCNFHLCKSSRRWPRHITHPVAVTFQLGLFSPFLVLLSSREMRISKKTIKNVLNISITNFQILTKLSHPPDANLFTAVMALLPGSPALIEDGPVGGDQVTALQPNCIKPKYPAW